MSSRAFLGSDHVAMSCSTILGRIDKMDAMMDDGESHG